MENYGPLTPYFKFLKETNAFHNATIYLLTAEIAVQKNPESQLANAHQRLKNRIQQTYKSPDAYITTRLFISYVASFELFLQETLSVVLKKHPLKIGNIEFRLTDIITAGSTEEIIQRAIEQTINKIMYRKPIEYLIEICDLLSVEHKPYLTDWKKFIEIKARRDLGVHNNWQCNSTYIRKLADAGCIVSEIEGASMIPTTEGYLNEVHDILARLSDRITKDVLATHWPELRSELGEI